MEKTGGIVHFPMCDGDKEHCPAYDEPQPKSEGQGAGESGNEKRMLERNWENFGAKTKEEEPRRRLLSALIYFVIVEATKRKKRFERALWRKRRPKRRPLAETNTETETSGGNDY